MTHVDGEISKSEQKHFTDAASKIGELITKLILDLERHEAIAVALTKLLKGRVVLSTLHEIVKTEG